MDSRNDKDKEAWKIHTGWLSDSTSESESDYDFDFWERLKPKTDIRNRTIVTVCEDTARNVQKATG